MERVKKRLNPRVVRAVLIFIITCAALYIVEYVIYARAVATVFIYATVYPPIFVLMYYIFGKRRQKKEQPEEFTKARINVAYMVLACFYVFYILYMLTGNTMRLSGWQILAVFTAFVIIALLHKNRGQNFDINFSADAASIVYSMILIVTAIFLIVTRPLTVAGAKKILEESGRRNVSFVTHYPPEEELTDAGARSFGVYSFVYESGGASVYVDVASGSITEESP